MKYVEIASFDRLSNQLSHELGDTQLLGGVELFTTKMSQNDKRLQRVLDRSIESKYEDDDSVPMDALDVPGSLPVFPLHGSLNQSLSTSLGSVELLSPPSSVDRPRRASHSSPFGPMDLGSNRKQYLYLISVLNASDPDRDFSGLQPDLFTRETNTSKVIAQISHILSSMGSKSPANMWELIDEQICLKDCNCYSLMMPDRVLADEQGCIWARMWFWFNKRRRRVVFLHLRAIRSYSPDAKPEDEDEEAILGYLD